MLGRGAVGKGDLTRAGLPHRSESLVPDIPEFSTCLRPPWSLIRLSSSRFFIQQKLQGLIRHQPESDLVSLPLHTTDYRVSPNSKKGVPLYEKSGKVTLQKGVQDGRDYCSHLWKKSTIL